MRRATSPIDDDDGIPVPKPAVRPDVGLLAAREALRAAFGPRLLDHGSVGQVVVVIAAGEAWSEAVAAAWQTFAKNGLKPVRLASSFEVLGERHAADAWTIVEQREARTPFPLGDVERALCVGLQVLVVAQKPDWLPLIVSASADVSVTVEPLSWQRLKRVAVQTSGGCAGMPPEPAEAVLSAITPRHLRLAVRRGEDAAALLTRAVLLATLEAKPTEVTAQARPHGLARVPGMGAALAWGSQLAADLSAYREGGLRWRDVDRGALLAGPPGTGKTTFAQALAEECGVVLVAGSHGAWQSAGHQGDMLKAMRRTFAEALASAPCLLLIDEVDSFPDRRRERGVNASYVRSMVNALLTELDGVAGHEGVVVIGACNHADVVDPAVRRAGRLDRLVEVGLPDVPGLNDVLRVHLDGELRDADLGTVARVAAGMSGADVEKAVREARRAARYRGGQLLAGDLLVAVAEASGTHLLPPGPSRTN